MLVSLEATMVGAVVVGTSGAGGGVAFAVALRLGTRFAAAVPAMIVADWIRVRRVSLVTCCPLVCGENVFSSARPRSGTKETGMYHFDGWWG